MSEHIRILLVDDHLISRAGLAALLGLEHNIDIVGQAADGVAAVELARMLHPDIVIMDVRMPLMNGIEATKLIAAEHPETKVIAFTMQAESDLCDAMQKAGASACLSKTAPIENLIETIRECHPS